MHLVADENWAVTISVHRNGGTSPAFLVGGGLLLLTAWTTSPIGGNLLGGRILQPERWGLDFAFVAVFAALSLSLWQSKDDLLLPWLVAAGLAVAGEHLLPGKLYIALGGIGGAMTAVIPEILRIRRSETATEDGCNRLARSGPARRFLDCLPGTILLSLTVSGALHAGVEGMIGLGACLLVFLRTRNLLLTMAAGMIGVCFFRWFLQA